MEDIILEAKIFQNRPLPTHTFMYRDTYTRLDKMTLTERPDIYSNAFLHLLCWANSCDALGQKHNLSNMWMQAWVLG